MPSPALPLPETTLLPSTSCQTLVFKNGDPIVSENELHKSECYKEREQNKSSLQVTDISHQQAPSDKAENTTGNRGTMFFHEDDGMDFDLPNNELDFGSAQHLVGPAKLKELEEKKQFQLEVQANRSVPCRTEMFVKQVLMGLARDH